jgi:hypothetical protein
MRNICSAKRPSRTSRGRVPPAKASVSFAAGDHGTDGIAPSKDAGHAARARARVATVLRLEESRRSPRPTPRDVGFRPHGVGSGVDGRAQRVCYSGAVWAGFKGPRK